MKDYNEKTSAMFSQYSYALGVLIGKQENISSLYVYQAVKKKRKQYREKTYVQEGDGAQARGSCTPGTGISVPCVS